MRLLKKKSQTSSIFDADPYNPSLVRGKREKCLATWWAQATPGTTYWRCLIPARHLPGQSLLLSAGDLAEDKTGIAFPRMKGETAVWQFLGDVTRSRMAMGLRTIRGVKTLMEVDDNYAQPPPTRFETTWSNTIEESKSKTGYSYEGNRIMAREVDGIITSTDYLADVYSEFNDNIWVCPNSIDPDDWKYPRAEPDGVFRIVYYASQKHMFDTPLVTKALKWASRQPGVEVWTVGIDPPDWTFPRQKVPWTYDLAEARKPLFRFDLGIAPVTEQSWSKAKSDVKILEYAMAGVLPFMSRAEPYKPWFDVAPDLVVEDGDWMDAIRWAVKNPDLVARRAIEVRDHVLEYRTIKDSIHLWREAIS